MRSTGGMQINRNKLSVSGRLVGSLLTDASRRHDTIDQIPEILPLVYRKGSFLFSAGDSAAGVFLLHSGRVKESMASSSGKTTILRVVGSGAMLGLSAVLMGTVHAVTAEGLEPVHADYVPKNTLLNLMGLSTQFSQFVAKQLSRNCEEMHSTIRSLSHFSTVSARLAWLIVQWSKYPLPNRDRNEKGMRILVTLTHEEIGQSVGISRESTTRALGELRKSGWISTNGSVWTISNEDAIRNLAAI